MAGLIAPLFLVLAIHAVPPGHEGELATLLGRGDTIAGCRWAGASIAQTVIHATYECAGNVRVPVDLSYPTDAPGVALHTGKFALATTQHDPAAAPLLAALADRLRAREDSWSWTDLGAHNVGGPAAAMPGHRRNVIGLIALLALVTGVVAVMFSSRRKPASAVAVAPAPPAPPAVTAAPVETAAPESAILAPLDPPDEPPAV